MSFPRYERYKDSGVEWLGEVPEHWEMRRLKYLADCADAYRIPLNAIERSERPGNVPYWGANCIMDRIDGFLFDEELVLLGEDGAPFFESFRPVAFLSQGPVWPNNHVHVLRSHSIDSRFLVASLNSTDYSRFVEGSTRDKLTQDSMMSIPVPLPSAHEQQSIVSFLAHETARIDALIQEQQRLIELLKEKRQAVISHAVTKGLDPTVPMKDSGVEWIGQVPSHWSVCPLSSRYQIQLGKMLDSAKIEGNCLRPYLRVADVQWGNINTEDLPEMDFDEEARLKFRLLPGDLLVNEGGSYPGRTAIWMSEMECFFQKALHRLRPHRRELDSSQFFYWVMRWASGLGVFAACGNEATIEHLPAERLRRYRFAFPPPVEQVVIGETLRGRVGDIESLIGCCESAITLLQERRSALISAAVTGKIDVRNYTPHDTPVSDELYQPA